MFYENEKKNKQSDFWKRRLTVMLGCWETCSSVVDGDINTLEVHCTLKLQNVYWDKINRRQSK